MFRTGMCFFPLPKSPSFGVFLLFSSFSFAPESLHFFWTLPKYWNVVFSSVGSFKFDIGNEWGLPGTAPYKLAFLLFFEVLLRTQGCNTSFPIFPAALWRSIFLVSCRVLKDSVFQNSPLVRVFVPFFDRFCSPVGFSPFAHLSGNVPVFWANVFFLCLSCSFKPCKQALLWERGPRQAFFLSHCS